jgi:pyruvate formate lyase activating enzyme
MKHTSPHLNRKEFLKKGGQALCLMALGGAGILHNEALSKPSSDYYTRPARLWRKLSDGIVECKLCPNGCQLNEGERGICRVRQNIQGNLYTINYSRIASAHVDPIEKKPMFHFLPGSTAYSIATAGCNMWCKFCQNWELSQSNPEDLDSVEIKPADLPHRAMSSGSKVIAYTYNEPTVQFEYIVDSAAEARKQGIRPIIISNGYILPEGGKVLAQNLDGIKIDLKAFTERFYSSVCGGSLKAVQNNLISIYGIVKWLEIVVLVIPTLNDTPAEIRSMAAWVRKNLSADVPMHFTRFRAMYKIQNLPPTPVSVLERCRTIAREEGIRYPYIGNVSGHQWENTYCHSCNRMLIQRSGYFHVVNNIRRGSCPHCGTRIPGIWT